MTDLLYVIKLEHDEKGIAFAAKKALQGFVKQSTSDITLVRLQDPTSKCSEIVVGIDPDNHYKPILEKILENSGRMPNAGNVWKINSIKRFEDDSLQIRLSATEDDYKISLAYIENLRAENTALKKQNQDAVIRKEAKPIDILLNYFKIQNYNLAVIIEKDVDLEFAKKVMKNEVDNTFINYFNYVETKNLNESDFEKIKIFDENNKELESLEELAAIAKVEMDYLKELEENKIPMPETLKKDLIMTIKSKNHNEVINKYQKLLLTTENVTQLKHLVEKEKINYKSFNENMEILKEASSEIPFIIKYINEEIEIYIPLITKKISTLFKDDLFGEIKSYFIGNKIYQQEHEFIVYKINKDNNTKDKIQKLITEVPLTLRLTGFNKIAPYIIG